MVEVRVLSSTHHRYLEHFDQSCCLLLWGFHAVSCHATSAVECNLLTCERLFIYWFVFHMLGLFLIETRLVVLYNFTLQPSHFETFQFSSGTKKLFRFFKTLALTISHRSLRLFLPTFFVVLSALTFKWAAITFDDDEQKSLPFKNRKKGMICEGDGL